MLQSIGHLKIDSLYLTLYDVLLCKIEGRYEEIAVVCCQDIRHSRSISIMISVTIK